MDIDYILLTITPGIIPYYCEYIMEMLTFSAILTWLISWPS